MSPAPKDAGGAPRVAVLARQGKFFVAEPFFGAGSRLVVSRDRQAAVGDLIVVRQRSGRNGRAGGGRRSRAGSAARTSPATWSRG